MASPRIFIAVGPHGIEKIQVDEDTRQESTEFCLRIFNSLLDLDEASRSVKIEQGAVCDS